MRSLPCGLLLCLGVATHARADVSFHGLGSIPGYGIPFPSAVSADGSTVVGRVFGSAGIDYGFRWTTSDGFQVIGPFFGSRFTYIQGVSADGSALAGYSGLGDNRALRWTQQAGAQQLLALPRDSAAYANGISADGSVVAGSSFRDFRGYRAALWSSGAEPEDLGTLFGGTQSYTRAVSGDGHAVVGWSQVGGDQATHPFVWTRDAGMQDLGVVAGARGASANDVNHDASIIVGDAYGVAGHAGVPFIWTPTDGMQVLALPETLNYLNTTGVSDRGNVVVGYAEVAHPDYRAWIWTPQTGMVNLDTFLGARGIDLTGWSLQFARDVSSDGTIIVGDGLHNGQPESWIAVIPSPASVVLVGMYGLGAARRRRA